MPLVIRKNKNKYFRGEGFFSSLLSTVTSKVVQDTAKEVAINVSKKVATELGNKVSEKVINKIFESKSEPTKQTLSPEGRMLLNNILSRGSGIRRI